MTLKFNLIAGEGLEIEEDTHMKDTLYIDIEHLIKLILDNI
jgi:hypothetical protein